jgi:hypothetical protein
MTRARTTAATPPVPSPLSLGGEPAAERHEQPAGRGGKASVESSDAQSPKDAHAASAPPSEPALASSRVLPSAAPPLSDATLAFEAPASIETLTLASTDGAAASAVGRGATSDSRRSPFGVPSPVGPSQPGPAVHITSLQRPSLSLSPEVTSLKSEM